MKPDLSFLDPLEAAKQATAWVVRWIDNGSHCQRVFQSEADALTWASRAQLTDGEIVPLYDRPQIEAAIEAKVAEERETFTWRDALVEIVRDTIARLDSPPFDILGNSRSRLTSQSHDAELMKVALGLPASDYAREDYQKRFGDRLARSSHLEKQP